MADEILFGTMTMPVVISPILDKFENKDMATSHVLKAAMSKVERVNPGFTYNFVKALLMKSELPGINMCETLLRLAGNNDSSEFYILHHAHPFQELNARAKELKRILSRIPQEIFERRRFLETIKEIAFAIKQLLDAVNLVLSHVPHHEDKQNLEHRKKEFVKLSRRFSNTLKDFFKANQRYDVFLSANYLVNQTNLIIRAVKNMES